MSGVISNVRKRINVSLAESTVRLLDRAADKGDRSRLIDEAIRYYVQERGRERLRKKLKEGAEKRAQRDLALAQDWFPIEAGL